MTLLSEAKMEQASGKVALFGSQGSGKTSTAAQLAIGLSLTYHNAAPVAFFDTEKGSDFTMPMFNAEGLKLLRSKSRAFQDLLAVVKEATAAGCCALIVDSISHPWSELMESFCKARKITKPEFHHWAEIKAQWREWTDAMLNSRLHMLIAGRAGKIYEYQDNEDTGKKQLITTGTKMKAEGEFGYEPDLLCELWLEREDGRKRGSKLVHKAIVLKDRSWALNGAEFAWADRKAYKQGDWQLVFKCFEPYFKALSIGGENRAIDSERSSKGMFGPDGSTEWHRIRKCKDVALETWDSTMSLLWSGSSTAEKRLRLLVGEKLFGVRSRTAVENLPLDRIEQAVKTLQAYEAAAEQSKPQTENDVLSLLESVQTKLTGSLVDEATGEKLPF